MQLAHPLVARGVADHSGFEADPFARLQRTLDASYTIVFGSEEAARRVARRIHNVHRRVTGDGYEANDPELLLWVHSTLVDTALRIHSRFLGPLPRHEAEAYYLQSTRVAELLGVPLECQPADLEAFRRYVRHQVATLQVSDEARTLARSVLHPKVPLGAVMGQPISLVARNLTAGLLPAPLRTAYGLSWDPARQAAFAAACLAARQLLPRVPGRLRRAPLPLVQPGAARRQTPSSGSRATATGRRSAAHRPSPSATQSTTSTT